MESIKEELLKRVPVFQRDIIQWHETQEMVSTYYTSNKGDLMCVMYDKEKSKIRNFSLA